MDSKLVVVPQRFFDPAAYALHAPETKDVLMEVASAAGASSAVHLGIAKELG